MVQVTLTALVEPMIALSGSIEVTEVLGTSIALYNPSVVNVHGMTGVYVSDSRGWLL